MTRLLPQCFFTILWSLIATCCLTLGGLRAELHVLMKHIAVLFFKTRSLLYSPTQPSWAESNTIHHRAIPHMLADVRHIAAGLHRLLFAPVTVSQWRHRAHEQLWRLTRAGASQMVRHSSVYLLWPHSTEGGHGGRYPRYAVNACVGSFSDDVIGEQVLS